MRIALAVVVLFGIVYMVALKPSTGASTAPASKPVATQAPASSSASDANTANTSFGKAVEAAHGAADAAEKSQAAQAGETTSEPSTSKSTPSTASVPATSAETAPAPAADDTALADLPEWLQKSMDHKVVAILFTNHKSADDRRTGKALKHAFTAHGKVVKRAVPVSQISKYRPVAEGVDVSQSPTLMVIDRSRGAQALVGYSSVQSINQAIVDGLLATDNPVKRVEYLQTVQRECREINNASIIGPTVGDTPAGARKNLNHFLVTLGASMGTLHNAPVPPAYKAVSHDLNRWLAMSKSAWTEVRDVAIGRKAVDTVKVRQLTADLRPLQYRTLLNLNAVGVDNCN
jgi:hypothetical protein